VPTLKVHPVSYCNHDLYNGKVIAFDYNRK
jgi:hypothetical protein